MRSLWSVVVLLVALQWFWPSAVAAQVQGVEGHLNQPDCIVNTQTGLCTVTIKWELSGIFAALFIANESTGEAIRVAGGVNSPPYTRDGLLSSGTLVQTVAPGTVFSLIWVFDFHGVPLDRIQIRAGAEPVRYAVRGVVFEDRNANGSLDTSEPRLGGRLVTLSGAQSAVAVTASDGSYAFTNLAPASYRVAHAVPADFVKTTDDSRSVTISTSDVTHNFGVKTAPSIQGVVFEDLNGNGVIEGSEPKLANKVVTLTGTRSGSAVTDLLGRYVFAKLPAGSYVVSHEIPTDYVRTTSDARSITLTTQDVLHNFGLQKLGATLNVTGDVYAGGNVANVTIDPTSVVSATGTIENVKTTNTIGNYTRESVEETEDIVKTLLAEQAREILVTSGGQATIGGIFNLNPRIDTQRTNCATSNLNTAQPEGSIWHVPGDLILRSVAFCGRGTIVVDGNVTVIPSFFNRGSIRYADSEALLGVIARGDAARGKTGDITFEANVKSVVGAYYAPNGKITIRSGIGVPQGLFVGKSIELGSSNISILYDGRITKNPPPGFSQSLVPNIAEVTP